MAAAKQISVEAALAAVLSELDGILALRDKQRTARRVLLGEQYVFALALIGFGKSLVKTLQRVAARHWMMTHIRNTPCINRKH